MLGGHSAWLPYDKYPNGLEMIDTHKDSIVVASWRQQVWIFIVEREQYRANRHISMSARSLGLCIRYVQADDNNSPCSQVAVR